ncbi:hypothetical protein pqer_cds_847 [Pandoravirus quercus]|uniref:F-box incomplete domain containing protein n=1 Tax=Pandoravirus quercus TaxID=2107709 RepID=A0A2U7UA12_9VIRU|nr:hypothetical protein pqer_cds_847 [Pandoravirus quercus]AVK75269.1 hypothetical protein pqer_cds_847 [Pandoravirus quercus]
MDDNLSLLDLPSEILCFIVALLDHPRDVVACACASPALACRSPLETAASYYRGQSEAALAAGLPIYVVRALFGQWNMEVDYRHLPAAARGGRVDVVRWVCDLIRPLTVFGLWTGLTAGGPAFNPEYAPAPDVPQSEGPQLRARACRSRVGARRSRVVLGSAEEFGTTGPLGSRGPFGPTSDHDADDLLGTGGQDATIAADRDPAVTLGVSCAVPSHHRGLFGVSSARHRSGPPRGPPDSVSGTLHLTGDITLMPYLMQAIYEAACAGHTDVLRYLTTACHLAKMPCALDVRVVVEAARRGTLSTVMYAHDRWPQGLVDRHGDDGDSAACCCPSDIADAAAAGDQRHVLDWMRAVRCRAFACTTEQLAHAIGAGNDRLVDAITRTLVDDARDEGQDIADMLPTVSIRCKGALIEAARGGHVRTLAIAHARGFVRLTADVMGAAAKAGQLDVLRWAAGETVPGVETCFAPTVRLPWDVPMVAWSVAECDDFGSTAVVDWLAARPETRRHFTAVMARTMLMRNRHAIVLWMHDTGIVSLSDGESLGIAIKSGLTCLGDMIDRGAACSPRAMAAALMHSPNADAIALLCERFGYDDLYEALRVHVYAIDNAAIRWVRDNVPNADVEHIIEAGNAHASARRPERSPAARRTTTRQQQPGLGWTGQSGTYEPAE